MRPKQLLMVLGVMVGATTLYIFITKRKTDFETDISTLNYRSSVSSKLRLDNIIAQSGKVIEQNPSSLGSKNPNVVIEEEDVATVAKRISGYNRTVLVTMVNDAYLSFTYSWLCNTKEMGIHKSVLIITTDETSKTRLKKDWPEISVVSMNMEGSGGDQTYSQAGYVKIMVKRTEMMLAILMADVEIFLFEVDCLWFGNPTPKLQSMRDADVLVNPVAGTQAVYAGGFLYLFTTAKAKALWKKVTEMMINLGERLQNMKDNQAISEADNDQQYFSKLITEKYGGISVKILTLDEYADGKWYEKTEADRVKSHPIIVNNNWVLGNKAKIERAKKWKHWFINEDWTCDMDLVHKTVYH